MHGVHSSGSSSGLSKSRVKAEATKACNEAQRSTTQCNAEERNVTSRTAMHHILKQFAFTSWQHGSNLHAVLYN